MTNVRQMALLTVLMACGLLAPNASAIRQINWSAQNISGDPLPALYDSAGSRITSDVAIQLIADQLGDTTPTILSDMISGRLLGLDPTGGDTTGWTSHLNADDDDVVATATWSWTLGSTVGLNTDGFVAPDTTTSLADGNAYENRMFYLRWFNPANTEAGLIYSSSGGWIVPNSATPEAADFTYTQLGAGVDAIDGSDMTSGSPAGWQSITPVPEPGTIGMFVLGLAAIAARRRANRR